MLFNSLAFLLGFLPAALLIDAAARAWTPRLRLPTLLALSAVFYAYWDWRFLPLLGVSVLINWTAAQLYRATRLRWLLTGAVCLDLLVLGLFKYEGFLAAAAGRATGVALPVLDLALPLGISFFSFHHIMYLTDLRRGAAPPVGLTRYGLYIAFFPQVLSGPLVRWSEILHQLDGRLSAAERRERLARGLLLLVLGLGKKVFLADALAPYADGVFRAAAGGAGPGTAAAWHATLAFTLQIYFDFSGYTDMALGIALMFGIVLPQNFDVPYRATSLQDFWRRWHMTLSRFLRDYLYVPLGGNRHGLARQLLALLATMTLGGLWHGAGWTFVAWGALHGVGLAAGLLWRRAGWGMRPAMGWALTVGFVALTWVLFRAPSLAGAWRIYAAMAGFADGGGHVRWLALLPAAAIATLGPTAWTLVHRVGHARWVALAAAGLALANLLKIADNVNYDFIYFQF